MVGNEQQLIFALEQLKTEMALDGVSNGGDMDRAYQHGVNVGTARGIELSKQRLMKLLHGDDDKHERKAKPNRAPYSA